METKLTPDPPLIREHHLSFPLDVARILGATGAHALGYQGQGIRIAVIDSGFFPHPFFLSRGFYIRYIPTRREPDPQVDHYGHGTAQLASVFAVAPRAEILAIKCLDRDPSYALRVALELKPDVISCAWGFDIDRAGLQKIPSGYRKIHRLIQEAVSRGACVVSAAGNGQRSFPGNMPEVLSVGGVYCGPDGAIESSDISSAYESGIFPGRHVPDVCGVTGKRPHGRLLLVPVPPRAQLARKPAFSTLVAGEAKRVSAAGWAMFSGTSAATAMVSGAAALLRQAVPALSSDRIRELLTSTSRSVPDTSCRLIQVDLALQAALRVSPDRPSATSDNSQQPAPMAALRAE